MSIAGGKPEQRRELPQKRFAELLRAAMKLRKIQNKDLAELVNVHAVTVSKWRSIDYDDGPPRARDRRVLESALELPVGYFEDDAAAVKQVLQEVRPSLKRRAEITRSDRATGRRIFETGARHPSDAEGWVWEEEQFRRFIREIERTARARVDTPNTVTEQDLRHTRLVVVQAVIDSRRKHGETVPKFMDEVYAELSEGRFE